MRIVLLASVLLALCSTPAFADKRVALVVGNSAYETVPALPNPGNDADAIAATLGELGFEVLLHTDLDQAEMADALGEFASALQDADVALFFYAGHGIQFDGRNYLISTNAEMSNQFALGAEAFALDEIVEVIQHSAAISLVLLDACRNNPFADRLKDSLPSERSAAITRGLAPISSQPVDTMIVYATAANHTAADGAGDHSPFSQALLDNLGTPGVEVSLMLKRMVQDVREKTLYNQSPEVLSAMAAEFYFGESPASASTPARQDDPATLAFLEASGINTTDAWRSFLATHGDTSLASYAKDALVQLEAMEATFNPNVPFPDLELALKLDGKDRQMIQKTLVALGYDLGAVDGAFGGATRRAVMAFQLERGLMPTGYVDTATLARLESDDVQAEAARSFQAAEGMTGSAAENALALTREDKDLIKLAISARRLAIDPLEGAFGSTTRNSIKQIQFQNGMTPDGYLSAELATELIAVARRDGAQLARLIRPESLAIGVDPRLIRAVTQFRGRPIKYRYFNDTLYVAVIETMDFDEAQAMLEGTNGHLVVFSSNAEKTFVDQLITGDDRFFICDRWCFGMIVGYFQLPTATRSSQGWVTVTGEPPGRIPWSEIHPNALDSEGGVGFAVYGGGKDDTPTFLLQDMIRFQQVGTGFIAEFPPTT